MANSTTLYKGSDGRTWVDVTLNKTLTLADSGIVQNVIATGVTVTAPATAAGLYFIIRNGGKPAGISGVGSPGSVSDGNTVLTLPTGSDGFSGNAFTPGAGKGANNNSGNIGDEIILLGSGTAGTDGYTIATTKGTWVRTT